jgi:hypothetical protein
MLGKKIDAHIITEKSNLNEFTFFERSFYAKPDELPESSVTGKRKVLQFSCGPATLRSFVDFVSSTDNFVTVSYPPLKGQFPPNNRYC